MPRADRSVALLTAMIFSAIYVILLLGFTREYYIARSPAIEADRSDEAPAAVDGLRGACGLERPICMSLFAPSNQRQSCVASLRLMRQVIGIPLRPLTIEGLQQAIRAASR